MAMKNCIPFGLLALTIGSVLLSGCTDTTADDSITVDDSTTIAATVSTTTTTTITITTTTTTTITTTTTSLMRPFATATRDLNGTDAVFDVITQTFFVALGTEGYASCGGGLNCTVWDPQSFGLSSVDDIAVADGLAFLLDRTIENLESSGLLAVAYVNGTVAQQAVEVEVNSRISPDNGVLSAASGHVVVSRREAVTVELQSFSFSGDGSLAFNKNASFSSSCGQIDVHVPSGNNSLAVIPTGTPCGLGFTIVSWPSLTPLNTVSLSAGEPLELFTSFSKKDGSLCLLGFAPGTFGGLSVVCDPDDASRRQLFQVNGQSQLRGASVAVGGDRAYLLARSLASSSFLTLVVIDLAPLENGSDPRILCEKPVGDGFGMRQPVHVATNTNGSQVLVSSNTQGLFFNEDVTCSS